MGTISDVAIKYSKGRMIRQQPEGHDTFASGDSCFCVAKVAPVELSTNTAFCELAQRQAVLVRQDKPSDRAIKSDRAKVVMTAGCISITH